MDSYDNDLILMLLDDDLFPVDEEEKCTNSMSQTR